MILALCVMSMTQPGSAYAAELWTIGQDLSPLQNAGPRPFFGVPSTIVGLDDGHIVAQSTYPGFTIGIARYSNNGTPEGPFGTFSVGDPNNYQLGFFGVEANDGTVWLTDTANHTLLRWNEDGQLLGTFGANGNANGEFQTPSGIDVAPNGTLLVVDTGNHRIQRFSPTGSFLEVVAQGNGSAPGQFQSPEGIAVAADGSFYVADSGNDRIQHLAADGSPISEWGTSGTADGELNGPYGIEILLDGSIVVSESNNSRLQRFTSSGTHLGTYGGPGTGLGQYTQPYAPVQLADGTVLVGDAGNGGGGRITALDGSLNPLSIRHAAANDNATVRAYASPGQGPVTKYLLTSGLPRICTSSGGCAAPFASSAPGPAQYNQTGAPAISSDGSIWLANDSNILHYDATGTFAAAIGTFGTGPLEFNAATSIFPDPDGSLWILDQGNQRIQHLSAQGTFLGATSLAAPVDSFGTLVRLTDGTFLIPDASNGILYRFAVDGSIVWQHSYGSNAIVMTAAPLGDGTLLVSSLVNAPQRLQISDGSVLEQAVDLPGSDFHTRPMSLVQVGYRRLLMTDLANSRVQVIRLGDPELALTTTQPIPGTITSSLMLGFRASGGTGTYSYAATWNGNSVPIAPSGALNTTSLTEGRHTLRVVASDSYGNSATWEQALTVDRTAPRFTVRTRFTVEPTVSLSVADNVSGSTVQQVTAKLGRAGTRRLRFTLRDRAGNASVRSVLVIRRPSLGHGSWNRQIELWRPGSTFTPGDNALRQVFGDSGKSTRRPISSRSAYTPALIREIQYRLKQLGYVTPVLRSSGVLDSSTRQALRRFQRAKSLPRTGLPNAATRHALDSALVAAPGLRCACT